VTAYNSAVDSQARFEERLAALRDAFVGGLPSRLDTMRVALDAGDRATVQREAHRLAGTGVSYGLPVLTEWGRAVERQCKQEASDVELRDALDRLALLVESLVPQASATG
jgi:HPt (histidine-containing phosphotransfer) domain-containing protein